MSNSANSDSARSHTLLSNLRHFRFQKKSATTLNNSESPPVTKPTVVEDSSSRSPVFIRNKSASVIYSDSEEEVLNSPNKTVISEGAVKSLKDDFPNKSPLELERCLISCKGDVAAAKSVLLNHKMSKISLPNSGQKCSDEDSENMANFKAKICDTFNKKLLGEQRSELLLTAKNLQPPVKRTLSEAFTSSPAQKAKKPKKDKKALTDYDDSGDSDDEDDRYNKQDRRVFDSDEDSDIEISDDMNTDQRQVYDFLSTASLSELLCMPNCSQKKAEAIIEQRPFTGWKNMVEKFQEGKNLGTEILNSAQEVLYTRQVVNQLMQKCTRLAVEMERAVSQGASSITNQPKLLNPSLKLASYQMVGLNWLLVLHYRRLNGILADEMGLGKTVQIIAFLAHLKETAEGDDEHVNKGPHLIVVPSSTMDNWRIELERWCPSLKFVLYYGNMDERKMMRIKFSQEGVKDIDVVLTTYSLITSTPEERKMFKVLPFNYVVFDEAHMLKNMNTQRFENLMRVNAKHRILMTGTPLQNNLLELMSLLTFVMPEMFAKKRDYLKCLFTKNTKTKSNDTPKESLPRFEQEQVAQAKRIMQPFVLRRLKKDVLKDLPTKTEEVVYCAMEKRQQTKYNDLITMFSKKAEKRELKEEIDEVSGMTMMMDLRKLSNHPLLIRDIYDEKKLERMAKILSKERDYKETNINYIKDDLSVLSDFQLHMLSKSFKSLSEFELSDDYILKSGKFEQLDKILPKLKEDDHRVLIFSQFVIMLNVLEEYLKIRGHKFLRLDGSTQVTIRPVTVMRFVSKSSIEENIYQVALEKLTLEREISEENEQSEAKSFIRLLKKALGMGDCSKLSPKKQP
ncbi:UNVERIFIED_CONTAM: hypothetical protein PYX00_005064 [Menopon gallinae]|uniref:SWI/SNF-related matrix-associated actin-dependent regulator of chromatin subfamily A containing DEAD/H box 1 homolog n=1 Tax=Menopon gallinae TaxID=328185 RepID=A0AAW2HR39_9NEOP